jgi:hypothetical protein
MPYPLMKNDDPPTDQNRSQARRRQGVKLGRPKIDSATERKGAKTACDGLGILKVANRSASGRCSASQTSEQWAARGRTNDDWSPAHQQFVTARLPPVGGLFILRFYSCLL